MPREAVDGRAASNTHQDKASTGRGAGRHAAHPVPPCGRTFFPHQLASAAPCVAIHDNPKRRRRPRRRRRRGRGRRAAGASSTASSRRRSPARAAARRRCAARAPPRRRRRRRRCRWHNGRARVRGCDPTHFASSPPAEAAHGAGAAPLRPLAGGDAAAAPRARSGARSRLNPAPHAARALRRSRRAAAAADRRRRERSSSGGARGGGAARERRARRAPRWRRRRAGAARIGARRRHALVVARRAAAAVQFVGAGGAAPPPAAARATGTAAAAASAWARRSARRRRRRGGARRRDRPDFWRRADASMRRERPRPPAPRARVRSRAPRRRRRASAAGSSRVFAGWAEGTLRTTSAAAYGSWVVAWARLTAAVTPRIQTRVASHTRRDSEIAFEWRVSR